MEQKNKGGRPRTNRRKAVTVRISEDAARLLESKKNKSEFIDSLIRGKVAHIECPECHNVFILKAED